ncbi:MAG: sporulation protein YabP [Eubacteriales bacterium]|nr:sporulation protein YabP [Eubacteriales bacterium]
MENATEHTLNLTNRETLSLTGISDVDSFNEEEILAVCSCGELTIKGDMLHIEELNLESGILTVSGKIVSLTYSEKFSSTSLLKRLFGG